MGTSNSCLKFDDSGFSEFHIMSSTFRSVWSVWKQKYASSNHIPFINKTLSKEIMKKTKLYTKFLKDRMNENKDILYSKIIVSLLWKAKKEYYENFDEKSDNKFFLENSKTFSFGQNR